MDVLDRLEQYSSSEVKKIPLMDIRTLLKYAIRAPSTHNSQPWFFKIKENSCEVFADPSYNLPEADPVGRDMYISIGCCLENLVLAAKHFGIFLDISITHIVNDRLLCGLSLPIAEIFFKENTGESRDPKYAALGEAILQRFNARGIFEKRPIDKNFIENFNTILSSEYDQENIKIDFVEDQKRIAELADLTRRGIQTAYQNKTFRKEMSGWINNALSPKTTGIPSQALRMPFFISFIFPKLVRYFNIGKKLGEINYKSICSAPALAILCAKDDNTENWINAGRVGERLMLECAARGIKTSIFAAAIEMGFGKDVQRVTGSSFKPQLLLALGHMDTPQKPTPREKIEKKII